MSLDTENIVILNYNQCDLIVDSGRKTYTLNASKDGIHPTVRTIPLVELQAVVSTSKAVDCGWIMFEEDKKEEIYKKLFIDDWENILTNKEIEKILINHDIDGLEKIIAIDNITYFDRVRMVLYNLLKQKKDISFNVTNLIDKRYSELQNRQRVSKLTLKNEASTVDNTQAKVAELSEQNANLQAQLDEMKLMMAQMIEMQKNQNAVPFQNSIDENNISKENGNQDAVVKKSPGRPKKN